MRRSAAARLARRLTVLVPKIGPLYFACRRYVDDCNGELNCDMYTNGEIALLRRHLAALPAPVVLDVGANVGDWVEAVLRINGNARVHAFEPSRETFARLGGRGFGPHVVLNNLGVGAQRCARDLNVYGEGAVSNSLFVAGAAGNVLSRERIQIVSLGDYCAENGIGSIDFLKIDVEGAEPEVLKGAAPLLAERRVAIVQFEYGEGWIGARTFFKDVFDWIATQRFPYALSKLTPHGLRPIGEYNVLLDNFRNANYVLTRQGGPPSVAAAESAVEVGGESRG